MSQSDRALAGRGQLHELVAHRALLRHGFAKVGEKVRDPAGDQLAAVVLARAVDLLPEVEVRPALCRCHQAIADRLEPRGPPGEIVLGHRRDTRADLLPVLRGAEECHPRDAADAADPIVEVLLECVHHHDQARRPCDGRGRREVADEQIVHASCRHGRGPSASTPRRPATSEGGASLIDLELPLSLEIDEPTTQRLRVVVHVLREALGDRDPDLVGTEHEGPVLGECEGYRLHERVNRVDAVCDDPRFGRVAELHQRRSRRGPAGTPRRPAPREGALRPVRRRRRGR